MSIEKQKMKEKLEREIKSLQESSKTKIDNLTLEHQQNVGIITQNMNKEKEDQQREYEDKLAELRKVCTSTYSQM